MSWRKPNRTPFHGSCASIAWSAYGLPRNKYANLALAAFRKDYCIAQVLQTIKIWGINLINSHGWKKLIHRSLVVTTLHVAEYLSGTLWLWRWLSSSSAQPELIHS